MLKPCKIVDSITKVNSIFSDIKQALLSNKNAYTAKSIS